MPPPFVTYPPPHIIVHARIYLAVPGSLPALLRTNHPIAQSPKVDGQGVLPSALDIDVKLWTINHHPQLFTSTPLCPEFLPYFHAASCRGAASLVHAQGHMYSSRGCHGNQENENGVESQLSGTTVPSPAPTCVPRSPQIHAVEKLLLPYTLSKVARDPFDAPPLFLQHMIGSVLVGG